MKFLSFDKMNTNVIIVCLKPSPSSLTNELRLPQFLLTKTTDANKSLKTDANGAH